MVFSMVLGHVDRENLMLRAIILPYGKTLKLLC